MTGYSFLSGASSTNNAFFFIQLKDWEERPAAEDVATRIAQRLNGKLAAINEGIAIAFGPPAIPGLGTGSGFSIMLQDRVGNSPDYLAEQTQAFMQAAAERPEMAGLYTTYRATVPQIYLDVDTQKTMKLGVAPADVNQTLGAFLGGAYVNDFNRFGRLYKVYVQAETDYRTRARRRLAVLRAQHRRRDGADEYPAHRRAHQRPRVHLPLQHVPRRRGHRPPGAGLQLGAGAEGAGGGGGRRCCPATCPTPGTPCRTRRRPPKAPAAWCSSWRWCSCS